MIRMLRPMARRIGGSSVAPNGTTLNGYGGIDWGNVFGGVTGAARDVFIAREKRRAVGRGADANTVAAMEPGQRPPMVGSFGSGGMGLAALGLGIIAIVLLVK